MSQLLHLIAAPGSVIELRITDNEKVALSEGLVGTRRLLFRGP